MTKTSCTIDQKVPEPMDEGDDDSASTVGTPETLHSVKVSIEAPKSVDPLHHGPATSEVEMVSAPDLTDSLTTGAVEPIEEPTPGDGEEGLPLSGSVGIHIKFRSCFNAKRLLEVKFPARWQTVAISEAESLELGAVWLELNQRSINDADKRPVWYPAELRAVSTGYLQARYEWLNQKATRSPRNFMRLKAFGLADENESNRAKRRASRFKDIRERDKLAKKAKMDEGEDSSSPDGPAKGINPQTY